MVLGGHHGSCQFLFTLQRGLFSVRITLVLVHAVVPIHASSSSLTYGSGFSNYNSRASWAGLPRNRFQLPVLGSVWTLGLVPASTYGTGHIQEAHVAVVTHRKRVACVLYKVQPQARVRDTMILEVFYGDATSVAKQGYMGNRGIIHELPVSNQFLANPS